MVVAPYVVPARGIAVAMRFPALVLCALAASGCLGGDPDSGASIFQYQCIQCHNQDGSGGIDVGGTVSADLRQRVPELTDEHLLAVLRDGTGTMPGQFSDDDDSAVDVLAYLRDEFEPRVE
jgi:mono/diheme cytochrome c family protein